MNRFTYTKDNNEVSDRLVVPIGFIFDDRNKVMCLDLSKYSGEELERMKDIGKDLHRQFLESLYDSDLSSSIRTFFYDSISEVE